MKTIIDVYNLTHVDLTNGNDIDFKYDAAGRRVEKKFTTYVTSGTTTTTTVTTYKYHYIGSQITTIEIDQTQTVDDGEETPVTTTTKDDEIRIHLGANSRPISFEYYTENQNTQQTTSATYYYHYDLHGNVIRVTNSSGTTVIQYTYDQLGTIVSQTNSSNIYNPFTYMGEVQVIHDDEFDTSGSTPKTGLYSSGSGYYNPHTGTFLGGSGAPASANPTSTSAEEPTAQSTKPASQLGAHAAIAAVGGGVPSTKTVAASVDVEPEPAATGGPDIIDAGPIQCSSGVVYPGPIKTDNKTGMGHDCWVEGRWVFVDRGLENSGWIFVLYDPMPYNPDSPFQALDAGYRRFCGGGRVRTVPMPMLSWCKACIENWQNVSQAIESKVIFTPVFKGGCIHPKGQMTKQVILKLVRERSKDIGLSVSPHDLISTFAKLAYKGSSPIDQIQLSLGH